MGQFQFDGLLRVGGVRLFGIGCAGDMHIQIEGEGSESIISDKRNRSNPPIPEPPNTLCVEKQQTLTSTDCLHSHQQSFGVLEQTASGPPRSGCDRMVGALVDILRETSEWVGR